MVHGCEEMECPSHTLFQLELQGEENIGSRKERVIDQWKQQLATLGELHILVLPFCQSSNPAIQSDCLKTFKCDVMIGHYYLAVPAHYVTAQLQIRNTSLCSHAKKIYHAGWTKLKSRQYG